MNQTLDPSLLALIVHDLRNPLNVIALMLPVLEADPGGTEGRNDLELVANEVTQLRIMLDLLGDFSAGLTYPDRGSWPFDPRGLLAELVATAGKRPGRDPSRLILAADHAPPTVMMVEYLARLALERAIENAVRNAGTGTVRIDVDGGTSERWVTRITVSQPPPATLTSIVIENTTAPRRILSSPDERLALDLILAARISERLGGSARLEVEPGQSSTLVLDWPTRRDA